LLDKFLFLVAILRIIRFFLDFVEISMSGFITG
jgi:hypothetical protein